MLIKHCKVPIVNLAPHLYSLTGDGSWGPYNREEDGGGGGGLKKHSEICKQEINLMLVLCISHLKAVGVQDARVTSPFVCQIIS